MAMDEIEDVDDLVRGSGIESHDYKILEAAANKDVDDLFEGTEELAKKIQLVRTPIACRNLYCRGSSDAHFGRWVRNLKVRNLKGRKK